MKRAGGGDEEDVQVLVERPSSFSHEDRHQQQQGAASLPTSAAARAPHHHHHRQQQVIRARPYYRRWSPWLVSAATVACVAIFLVTMYVNDCPRHSSNCAAGFLGRFAFQPLRENPLLGPSSATLVKMGALDVPKVVHGRQGWRLITCMWLHAGVVHLLINMLCLVIIGIRLEQEFGFVRIGLVYLISGFGGSLMSALFIQSNVSVGASGALFGLIGSMLSELITNWSLYANKVAALLTLVLVIVVNLALGLLPRVDNFAHIGGLISGFLLGFVFFIRPQFAWLSQHRRVSAAAAEAQPGGQLTTTAAAQPVVSVKRKHKTYQYVLWLAAAVLLVVGFTVATVLLFRGYNANEHCPWCHYLSCVPTKRWRCDASPPHIPGRAEIPCAAASNVATSATELGAALAPASPMGHGCHRTTSTAITTTAPPSATTDTSTAYFVATTPIQILHRFFPLSILDASPPVLQWLIRLILVPARTMHSQ